MKILLYRAKGSNSSERVEWVLDYKKIPYQKIEISSNELSSSYQSINSFGYVPSLLIDNFVISESMAMIEYLEERFKHPLILGKTTNERALVRRICDYVNSTIHSPQNRTVLSYFHPSLSEESKRTLRGQWIIHCLKKLESSICNESNYAIGKEFSAADIFIACIYKKALQHGSKNLLFYDTHLNKIRENKSVAKSEPAT